MPRSARHIVGLLACLLTLVGIAAPVASADRAFSPRFTTNDQGDIAMAANTLMTCPSTVSTCAASQAGTNTLSNGDYTMGLVDVDSDATTFDSSQANLTVPAGSTVLFAGLYWAADSSSSLKNKGAPTPAAANTVKFSRPGLAGYTSVTASQFDTSAASATQFQGFADVTSAVQAGGSGTYGVANVQAGQDTNRYAGWSLVVVYRDLSASEKNLKVYDGYQSVASGASATIALNNYVTPATGTVTGKLGLVGWEGDLGLSTDSTTLGGTTLSDAANPAGNLFNSSISNLGTNVTTKNPNYVNQLSFDSDILDITGVLPAGSTSSNLVVGSSGDVFSVGAVALAITATPRSPAGTAAPVVSGTARDGQTLSTTSGTWSGTVPMTYSYQWKSCDTAGANCADISGATSSTYTLTSAEAGKTVRVAVTATNGGGSASQTSAQTGAVAAVAPANVVLPTIIGTARDGQTLTSSQGSWTGTTPLTYTYQWKRCDTAGANCTDISGATSSTYTLAPADTGKTVRVAVTATNTAGSATALATQTGTVAVLAPSNTAVPTITGTARDGQTLTSGNGTWSGTAPLTYTYQWKRCDATGANCADISGATSSTYTLVPADAGSTMRSLVTAANSAGAATANSAQTGTVASITPANTAAPVVSGTARDGQTLSTTNGSFSGTTPLTYTYQWKSCDTAGANCADIAGATSSTYTLTSSEAGKTVRAIVTATNTAGSANGTSAQTGTVAANAPANVVLPTITGTARDGQTLTSSQGSWTGTTPLTFTYQWKRCDTTGANCADITGATNSTYALVSADAGKTIRAAVTATNTAGFATATAGQTSTVATQAPANTAAPVVSGTARDGQTLSTTNGTFSGTTPLSYAYQWARCDTAGANCADVTGATSFTYTLVSADAGKTMRAVVTATNAAGSDTGTSNQAATVAANAPANTAAPVLSGTARDGQTLATNNGTFTGTTPLTYSYQWKRCDTTGANCTDISGATSSTYTLVPADAGKTVRAVVTATNAAGSANGTSAQTATVAANAPANTAAPVVSGTARDGQTLSTTNGSFSGTTPLTYTYQWKRCDTSGANCTNITGATSATYTLVSADAGKTIRAVVTATNAAGSDTGTSNQTSTVAANAPVNTVAPVVSGTARDGQALSTTNGTFTGTTPLTYSYQWKSCDTAGANCTDIPGATSSSYTLVSADAGKTIRAAVTATNAAGSSTGTSAQTGTVAAVAPADVVLPTITGTARDGLTLTSSQGGWSGTTPMTYTYQWQRCDTSGANCAGISGATDSAYTLTSPDSGQTVRVLVTATNTAGSATALATQTGTVAYVAPSSTVAPALSGTPRDGQTLTADHGTFSGTTPMTYTYQWQQCDAQGANCANVFGATGPTYDLGPSDVGNTVRAVVTATNPGGSDTRASSPSAVVAPRPPANTVAPSISGTPRDGQTLTGDRGTWTGTPTLTYAYQWQHCDTQGANCADIAGATDPSYTLISPDAGTKIKFVVTASNAAGPVSADSAPTPAVAAVAPANTNAPSVAGTPRDGQTLTAGHGTFSGTTLMTYAYQWQRCDAQGANCADVPGATDTSYDLASGDVGQTFRAVVTATNAAGNDTASSPVTTVVAAVAPSNYTWPAVTGTTADGRTLTTGPGVWTGSTPMTYSYEWKRCDAQGVNCTFIASATSSSYELTSRDVGRTLRSVVTAHNAAGSTDQSSAPTDAIAATAPSSTLAPSETGTARDGQTLTADHGTFSGTTPMTYTYQWQRCDEQGANCDDIPGATGGTYDLTSEDVGKTVRVVVTATNAAGADTRNSDPSPVVAPRPPANTVSPSISGTLREGQVASGDRGTWTGSSPMTPVYQWQRCDANGNDCSDVAGATQATYTLSATDIGKTLRLVVTATNAAGRATAASSPTSRVGSHAPDGGGTPTIAGTPLVDSVLTADHGTFTGTGLSYAFQWQRCDANGTNCADIAGATGSTYKLGAADLGSMVRVRVTASNDGGSKSGFSTPKGLVAYDENVIPDLPGSLIAPGKCGKLITNRTNVRATILGAGKVRIGVTAGATVTPSAPLVVSTKGSAKTIKSVEYRLDGRLVGRSTVSPWSAGIKPSLLKVGKAQKLTALITPRKRVKGKASKAVVLSLSSANCAGLYTATMKSGRVRSVKLRIDSRATIGSVRFTLPKALLPLLPSKSKKAVKVGFTTVTMRGNRRRSYSLMAGGRTPKGKLLLAGVDRPGVTLSGGKATLVAPKGTGRFEITFYLPAPKKGARVAAKAATVKLGAVITSGSPARRAPLSATLTLPGR